VKLTKHSLLAFGALILTLARTPSLSSLSAQKAATSAGTLVKMIVTVEARHGHDVPTVHREDVVVHRGQNRVRVMDWVPLQEDHAGMDLFILLDDGSDTSLALQFEDLRNFINAQPPTTRIAVGYMRNGTVDIVQDFTREHAAVGKALRLPIGSPGNSPYFSLMDLMKRLSHNEGRLEILLVSDGIDPGQGFADPYVDSTIEQAQRSMILIYTIYASGAGRYGHDVRRINLGQSNLSRLAGETGGEAYFQGFHNPITFAPFLADLATQLSHQYLLTFAAQAEKKETFERVKLETEVPNAELVTADGVYVPAVSVTR
jgi:hypothetical protein